MQAGSAEIGNEAKGGNSDVNGEAQWAQFRSDNYQNKGPGNSHGHGRGFPCGRDRGGNTPRGGGHQLFFCRTQVEERSDSEIESIYQNNRDNSINSEGKGKEGVSYFLKSRLLTAHGTVSLKKIVAI